jgi:hypothetical protein
MSEYEDLPEFYKGEGGTKTADPVYEALSPCQIMMTSSETQQTGPTRVETGEHFSSQAYELSYAWKPLNKAAGERMERWLDSLPVGGGKSPLTLEEITEAAHALRPQYGEEDLDHKEWHYAVMKHALALREQRSGRLRMPPQPARDMRGGPLPIMPFASQGQHRNDLEYGRPAPAQHMPQMPEHGERRARRARVQPPMPGALPTDSPQDQTR